MRPEICYYKSPYHVEHSYSKERKYLQGMEMKHLYFYLPFRIKKKIHKVFHRWSSEKACILIASPGVAIDRHALFSPWNLW